MDLTLIELLKKENELLRKRIQKTDDALATEQHTVSLSIGALKKAFGETEADRRMMLTDQPDLADVLEYTIRIHKKRTYDDYSAPSVRWTTPHHSWDQQILRPRNRG